MRIEGMDSGSPLVRQSAGKEAAAQTTSVEKVQQLSNETAEGSALVGAGQHFDYDKADIEKVIETMNEFMKPTHTSMKFEMHEELDRYYVTVIDSETQEVIKEIPPKRLLDAYAKMAEYMGFIVDKKI